MNSLEKFIKILNKTGDEVENYMCEYDLNDEELQLVENTIVEMKQRIVERYKRMK